MRNRLSPSLAATVETRATELRFSSRCPRRHLVHGGLAIAAATVFLDRATEEEQSTFYTDCCCCRPTYELPNHLKKKVSYELLLVLQQSKMYLTTVQETANSSACNHIFNFQRRGPPRRRARKLLSLCHTHGSATRSPYLPCQIMVQRKS